MRKIYIILFAIAVLVLAFLNVKAGGNAGIVKIGESVSSCEKTIVIDLEVTNMTDGTPNGECAYSISVPSGWTVNPTSPTISSGTAGNGHYYHTVTAPSTAAAGTYTYTVSATMGTVNNATSGSGTGNIILKTKPNVGISANPSGTQCAGTSVTLSGGGAQSYTWAGGSTSGSNVIIGAANTTYTVTCTGTAANSCSSTATASVSFYPDLDPGSVTTGEAWRCVGVESEDIVIGATTVTTGAGDYGYLWFRSGTAENVGSGVTYTITRSEIASLGVGDYTYTRKVKDHCHDDANAEQSSSSFILHIVAPPSISGISPTSQNVCQNGTPTSITVTASTTGVAQYMWYNSNDEQVYIGNPFVPPTTNYGDFTYYCVVSDGSGCGTVRSSNVTAHVWKSPTVTASVPHTSSCVGVGITLSASANPGDGTISSYSWSATTGGGTASSTTSTCMVTPTAAGNPHTYAVTVTDSNECEATAEATIPVYGGVSLSLSPAAAQYESGSNITINASPSDLGAGNYSWASSLIGDNLTSTTSSQTVRPLVSATYMVTATTDQGCTVTGSRSITVFDRETSGGSSESDCGPKLIYCATNGSDSNDGSSTAPVATLNHALSLATGGSEGNPAIVRMASGTYDTDNPINLISNVLVDGGWDADIPNGVWTKGTGATIINRTAANIEGRGTSYPRLVAIEGKDKSNFILQDVTVRTADAPSLSEAWVTGNTISNYNIKVEMSSANCCNWCNNYNDCYTQCTGSSGGHWYIGIVGDNGTSIGTPYNDLTTYEPSTKTVSFSSQSSLLNFIFSHTGNMDNSEWRVGYKISVGGKEIATHVANSSSEPIEGFIASVRIGFSFPQASVSGNSIVLSWEESVSGKYTVKYRLVGAAGWTTAATGRTSRNYTISGLPSGNYEW